MNKFEQFNFSKELFSSIKKLGFTEPTQIQKESIPAILKGQDVIGESSTGSGKTLAFGAGIIEHVQPKRGLQAVVLTPTRELAEQVKESIKKLAYHKSLKIAAVYGGVGIEPQIHALTQSEVVVATPGRFIDHLNRRTIDVSQVNFFVLDEADRMLDMGFIEDIEKIIRVCPKKRQTLFFSATISPRIQALADNYMTNPLNISAKKMVDPSKLKQFYYDVLKNMKLSLLVHLLNQEKNGLVMVFCNTRSTTDFVEKNLRANGVEATAIHGGLTQNKRSKTLEKFNSKKTRVLVCTDVAARGLHIDNVSHVYNYEIPKDSKEYIHRIGRTARAGAAGKVINLICDSDHENYSRLLNTFGDFTIEKLDRPNIERVKTVRVESSRDSGRGNFRGNGRGNSRGFSKFNARGGFSGIRPNYKSQGSKSSSSKGKFLKDSSSSRGSFQDSSRGLSRGNRPRER